MPSRIRLSRAPGWRKPAGAVVVSRPTRWGNPYVYRTTDGLARVPAADGSPWEWESRVSGDGTRHDMHWPDGKITAHQIRFMTLGEIVTTYRRSLLAPTAQQHLFWRPRGGPPVTITVDLVRAELAGRDLACWCPLDQPCHADILLTVANTTSPPHALDLVFDHDWDAGVFGGVFCTRCSPADPVSGADLAGWPCPRLTEAGLTPTDAATIMRLDQDRIDNAHQAATRRRQPEGANR